MPTRIESTSSAAPTNVLQILATGAGWWGYEDIASGDVGTLTGAGDFDIKSDLRVGGAYSGTLTIADGEDVTLDGGGTLNLASYTLTAPESLTVAGRDVANTFSQPQTISVSAPSDYPLLVESDQPTSNGSAFGVTVYSSSAAGRFFFARAAGSLASPSAVASGNRLATLDFAGYDGSAFTSGAAVLIEADAAVSSGIVPGRVRIRTANSSGTLTDALYINSSQQVGLGVSPAARLDVDTGSIRLAERSTPSAPAANAVLLYADDNGAGKTRLMALFSSGAAQQVAIQP